MSEQFKMSVRSNPALETTLEVFDSSGLLVGWAFLSEVEATIKEHRAVTPEQRYASLDAYIVKLGGYVSSLAKKLDV